MELDKILPCIIRGGLVRLLRDSKTNQVGKELMKANYWIEALLVLKAGNRIIHHAKI